MAIQMRRGANADFDESKMLAGELAVTTDGTRKVYAAFGANDAKELASKEDVQGLIDGFTSVVDREIAEAEQRIESKAETVLGTIPDDYETVSKKADEAVRTKADAIVCSVSGVNPIAKDSSDDYLRNMKLYGKTTKSEISQTLENVGKMGNYLNLANKTTTSATFVYEKVAVNVPKGTYTFSCKHNLDSSLGWWVAFYNADGTNVGGTGTNRGNVYEKSFEITDDAVLASIYFNGGVTVSEIMLNEGITALSYRPYTGQLEIKSVIYDETEINMQSHISLVGNGLNGIPVTDATLATYVSENGQMICSDVKDNRNGVNVQNIGTFNTKDIFEVFKSSIVNPNGNVFYFTFNNPAKPIFMMCDKRIVTTGETAAHMKLGEIAIFTSSTGSNLCYVILEVETAEEALAYMRNEASEIQYILETPIETPLSASEIASYKALHSNYKVTSVMNDCGAFMEVQYNADTKCYLDNLEKKHNEEIAENIKNALGYTPADQKEVNELNENLVQLDFIDIKGAREELGIENVWKPNDLIVEYNGTSRYFYKDIHIDSEILKAGDTITLIVSEAKFGINEGFRILDGTGQNYQDATKYGVGVHKIVLFREGLTLRMQISFDQTVEAGTYYAKGVKVYKGEFDDYKPLTTAKEALLKAKEALSKSETSRVPLIPPCILENGYGWNTDSDNMVATFKCGSLTDAIFVFASANFDGFTERNSRVYYVNFSTGKIGNVVHNDMTTLPSTWGYFFEITIDKVIGRTYVFTVKKVNGCNFELSLLDTTNGQKTVFTDTHDVGSGNGIRFITTSGSPEIINFNTLSTQKNNPKILFIGDSFIEGGQLNVPNKDKRYCALVRDDEAIKGDTFIYGLAGRDSTKICKAWYEQIKPICKPMYAVLEIGTNDKVYEDYITNMTALIEDMESNGIIPILCTLTPNGDNADNYNNVMQQANSWIRSSGKKYVDFSAVLTTNNGLTRIDSLFLSDNVHPNIEGNAVMFDKLKADVPEMFE